MRPIMLVSQLLFAASAAAFLVVPKPRPEDEDALKALPIDDTTYETLPYIAPETVDVPCPSCKGPNTHLQMEFAVEDGTRLTMNGFELYPEADPWSGDLIASEVRGDGKDREQNLGYSLAVAQGPTDAEQGMELINVELRIIQVGGRFADDIPAVLVQLIKAGDELVIGKMDIQTPQDSQAECTTIMCEVRNRIKQVKDSMRKGMSCGGRHGRPGMHNMEHKHHGHGRHGHGHGHGPRARNFGRLVKNIAVHVILPVLVGLVAGVGVAVLVMSVCTIIAVIFSAARSKRSPRSSRRRCLFHRRKAAVNEAAAEEEKTGLMDAQDIPPEYTDDDTSKQTV